MNRGPPRLDHPGQIVQGGVHVGAADRLDERAGHVVVLVAVPVVLHGGPVDGGLDRLQGDLRLVRGERRTGRRLQGSERPARVSARDAQQMRLRVLGQGEGTAEPALVRQRPAQQITQVVVGQRFQGEQQGPRQQRGDDREVRILRGGGDQGHPAVLHGGEQGVLLGLGEAVDLVQEEDGLLAVPTGGAARALDDGPDLLDPGGDRGGSTKRLLVALLTTYARVVFPVPGGPHRITDDAPAGPPLPSTSRRSGEPGFSRCCWPTTSSRMRGRIRTARGLLDGSFSWRSSAAAVKRSGSTS